MLRSQSRQSMNQSINRTIKHQPIHDKSTLPKSIMSPGVPNGEPVVGSDGSRKKGKATPDTLVYANMNSSLFPDPTNQHCHLGSDALPWWRRTASLDAQRS